MSDADTTERPDTLYVTDAEMIRRMGVPESIAREINFTESDAALKSLARVSQRVGRVDLVPQRTRGKLTQ